jgi:hypothetical protein
VEVLDTYVERINPSPYLSLYPEINSKWVINLPPHPRSEIPILAEA